MEAKLSISDIEYVYNLAEHKTDEELAAIIKKPLGLIQMLFALMTGLPKRPWEKVVLPDITITPPVSKEKMVEEKKQTTLKPLVVGKKRRKVPIKKKAVSKKKAKKEEAEKKPHTARVQALERQKQRQVKDRNSIYATKPIDLTGKVPMKLNSKTIVYVKPGEDIEKLKKKYKIA